MNKSPGIFRSLHHVCIVVRDLEASVAYYESLGVGPWADLPSLEPFGHDLQVPDQSAFLRLKYKYATLENVQIQLCEPPEGNTPQRTFLERQGEGVFHLGFNVADCDAGERQGVNAGLAVLMHGRKPDGSGFTYFDTADRGAGVTLEIRAAAK
jgi:methylmalonyl-CoA/ethylmalonyl-CoA epimerase